MPNLNDIVTKNDDGSVSVTLTDGRIAIVDDLPASVQYTIDTASIAELIGMRAVFGTKKIGEHDVKIVSPLDYGKTLDIIGDSSDLNRITGAFTVNFMETDASGAFISDGPGGTALVEMVDGSTATLKRLTARQQAFSDGLAQQPGLAQADTRALCALTEINSSPVKVSSKKDLDNALIRLGSGRNLDRITRAFATKFIEEIDLPNS